MLTPTPTVRDTEPTVTWTDQLGYAGRVSGPGLPAIVRQLWCLAEMRGTPDAPDLRAALPVLDRLDPAVLDSALGRIPFLLRRLIQLRVADHEQALALVRDLRVATLADLLAALDDPEITSTFAPADRLAATAELLALEVRPLPLGRALELMAHLQEIIARHCPAFDRTDVAGDARRYEPIVRSLVLVGRTSDPSGALDSLASAPGIDDVVHRSGRRAIVLLQHNEVDVRVSTAGDHGTVLFAATGAPAHVRAVTRRSHQPQLRSGELEIYSEAGLSWIPPEVRNASGEIEAAAAGGLPRLVERRDIRGDLHMHSSYSDGQDSVETMLAAAARSGYEYVAITDHSTRAAASRTVSLDQLERQRDEIARLREQFPGLVVLHGIEVEILPDGRLDFDDKVLSTLDIVLASLHERAGQNGAALTRRCLRAIRHPLVNVITHPANRLVGRRAGYPMDYDSIYAAAAETGTALEIDGAPGHLDLDGEHARAAVANGVTVTIDSDCHRAAALDRQMEMGIGTARRGWVEARSVLNARPIDEVRAFIARKRRGKSL